jgi:putative DNA-invertase from lambdoid prophage Rac
VRAAIYTRMSTAVQNSELQLREIQDYANRQGWQIVGTYQDTISGTKTSRPGLKRLMADAMVTKFLYASGSWAASGAPWWTV